MGDVKVDEGSEEVQTEETTDISTEGLSPEEISMAQEQGLMDKPEGEEDKETEEEADETEVTKEEKKEITEEKEGKEEDRPSFEEMTEDPEKEQKVYKEFSKNEQGLYFKYKKERGSRQKMDRENELLRVKLSAHEKKKDSPEEEDAEEDLSQDEFATRKDSQKMVRDEIKKNEEAKNKEAEQQQKAQAEVSERLNLQEAEAKSKHDDFDDVLLLAKDVMQKDKYGVYAQKMVVLGADPEGNVAEYLYDLGKSHPDYQSGKPKPKTKDTTKINKMIANSQKKTSSAMVSGGGNARITSEDELQVSDMKDYSTEDWSKLTPETRARILKSTC